MPIYEYRCEKCGNRFEVLQKFSDAPLTEHEGCGGAVERLISAPGFQFKGSGWYITDYKNSGAKPESKASESKGESKADGSSESKPAASERKTESKPAETSKTKND